MIKEKNIVYILASITVLSLVGIGFSVYHTAVTSTLDASVTEQIQPIKPQFSRKSIQNILDRSETSPTYSMNVAGTRVSSSSSILRDSKPSEEIQEEESGETSDEIEEEVVVGGDEEE